MQRRHLSMVSVLCLLAPALLVGSLSLGLREPGDATLESLPREGGLDYALRRTSLAPLTERFVGGVLGGVAPGTGLTAGPARGQAGVGGRGPIAIEHAFTNDDYSKAYVIPSVPFTARTNTATASREADDPEECAPVGGTAWYRFTPTSDVRLIASTIGSSYATALAVFSDGDHLEGCARDAQGNALLALRARAGVIYDFQITGPVNGGLLVFNLLADGATTRASVSDDGSEAEGPVIGSWMSANGRYVAFLSFANHTKDPAVSSRACWVTGSGTFTWRPSYMVGSVTHDPACPLYTYIRDRATHQIVFSAEGITGIALSASGRYLAAHAYDLSSDRMHVILYDRITRSRTSVSVSVSGRDENGGSFEWLGVSANGRFVGFTSSSSNLVEGDTNGLHDVFLRDTWRGRTIRVSVSSEGAEANGGVTKAYCYGRPCDAGSYFMGMSSDGRWIAFRSAASNLVPGDTNGAMDVFVHDRLTRKTERVSVSSSEKEGNGDTLLAAFGVGQMISDNGRFVLFNSRADNLVPDDTNDAGDLFLRDRWRGTTQRVTVSSAEEEARGVRDPGGVGVGLDDTSFTLSGDGRYAVFKSYATNLAPGDSNGTSDVFVRDVATGVTTLVSVSSEGVEGDDGSWFGTISADGRFVHFVSSSTNLVAEDRNGSNDAFTHEIAIPGRSLSDWY